VNVGARGYSPVREVAASRKGRGAFTLVELLVVVIIIGVLASVGIPQYLKTVETSRATDAIALVQAIANANRMYRVDNPAFASGQLPGSPVNPLITNKYIADQDWGGASYNYYACNGTTGGSCCASDSAACAQRKTGAYSGWGYRISNAGVCATLTADTPGCPAF